MKVLIFVPQSRVIGPVLQRIHALDVSGFETALVFDRMGDDPDRYPYENAMHKMQRARRQALDGRYDALLSIEDDILVPRDALAKLAGLEADVAYGFAVWRNEPHQWSVTFDMEWNQYVDTLDLYPDRAREAWGRVVECLGCGLFCTLIRREVLEEVEFRLIGQAAVDWGLSFDARDHGFIQKSHLGVVCGHVELHPTPRVYWPDINGSRMWREERL